MDAMDKHDDMDEMARLRSARRRVADRLDHLPATHDLQTLLKIAVRRWMAERGVRTLDDLDKTSDEAVKSLVKGFVRIVRQSRFDDENRRTWNRVAVFLGLDKPMEPRPRLRR